MPLLLNASAICRVLGTYPCDSDITARMAVWRAANLALSVSARFAFGADGSPSRWKRAAIDWHFKREASSGAMSSQSAMVWS
jgi:hypothetical protein